MHDNKWFFFAIGMTAIALLSSCQPNNAAEGHSFDPDASGASVSEISDLPTVAITDELLAEYKAKHKASVAVIDMLIPQQALILGDESIVKLLVLEGITGETVIPRDSVARIEKTEISGAGMVTVKIVDKTGKEVSFTLTPEDAAKVSE